jgi:hypothetical protein
MDQGFLEKPASRLQDKEKEKDYLLKWVGQCSVTNCKRMVKNWLALKGLRNAVFKIFHNYRHL